MVTHATAVPANNPADRPINPQSRPAAVHRTDAGRRLEEEVPPQGGESPGGDERTPADGQLDGHDHLGRDESHGQDREVEHEGDQRGDDDPRQHQGAQVPRGHPRRLSAVDGEGRRPERDTSGDQRGDEEQ